MTLLIRYDKIDGQGNKTRWIRTITFNGLFVNSPFNICFLTMGKASLKKDYDLMVKHFKKEGVYYINKDDDKKEVLR